MGGIFVSYRRSDSQGEAGRLFDDLVQHFDEHTVFMDVSAIEAGRDFRKAIEEGVTNCGVLLVMIGPEWVTARDERGARRLEDPGDFVRIETASALRRDIPVIPVLVRGARMPSSEQLPDDLKELAYRNCIELTHARWRSDIQLLLEALRRLAGPGGPTGTVPGEATSSPQPSSLQPAATKMPNRQVENPATLDTALVERVSRELADYIGPIAGIVVRRAALRCTSVDDLYRRVSEEIDSPAEREKFLQQAAIPSTPSSNVGPATLEPSTAQLSDRHDSSSKNTPPSIKEQSSGRWKYVLAASVVGVLLILTFVFAAHIAKPRNSQNAEAWRQEAQVAAPNPVATEPPPEAEPGAKRGDSQHNESLAPQRIRVSPEVSQNLLLRRVVPAYPLLARQARIQGMVVFDAEISRAGAVEHLSLVSGHPLLIASALEAVKQWRYKPYVLNGEPTPVRTQISVNFTLKGG